MTPKERAAETEKKCSAGARLVCRDCIEDALNNAIEEEREACARIADSLIGGKPLTAMSQMAEMIARLIRHRGEASQ